MEDKENVEKIIASQSKMLGSRPAKLYLTENEVIIGNQKIEKKNIEDLKMIEDKRTDYRSIGVILMNTLIGILFSYTLTSYIPLSALIIGLSSLLGYLVVRFVREEPYGYVSLETDKAEYRFGIADPISAAEFFGSIYEDMEKELTPEILSPKNSRNEE
jgi:hypothetical protein